MVGEDISVVLQGALLLPLLVTHVEDEGGKRVEKDDSQCKIGSVMSDFTVEQRYSRSSSEMDDELLDMSVVYILHL